MRCGRPRREATRRPVQCVGETPSRRVRRGPRAAGACPARAAWVACASHAPREARALASALRRPGLVLGEREKKAGQLKLSLVGGRELVRRRRRLLTAQRRGGRFVIRVQQRRAARASATSLDAWQLLLAAPAHAAATREARIRGQISERGRRSAGARGRPARIVSRHHVGTENAQRRCMRAQAALTRERRREARAQRHERTMAPGHVPCVAQRGRTRRADSPGGVFRARQQSWRLRAQTSGARELHRGVAHHWVEALQPQLSQGPQRLAFLVDTAQGRASSKSIQTAAPPRAARHQARGSACCEEIPRCDTARVNARGEGDVLRRCHPPGQRCPFFFFEPAPSLALRSALISHGNTITRRRRARYAPHGSPARARCPLIAPCAPRAARSAGRACVRRRSCC
jgi:hypothetical protein